MRSRLTWSPAARAASTARATLAGVVGALEGREHVRHRRLHAEQTRVKPPSASRCSALGRHRVGVGLGGDLGAGRQPEPVADAVEHPHEVVGRQQRRGAAADEHRLDRGPRVAERPRRRGRSSRSAASAKVVDARAVRAQLGQRVGVEVAVAAAHRAERHVQVDAERALSQGRQGRRGQRPVSGRGVAVGQGARHPAIVSAVRGAPCHGSPDGCRQRQPLAGAGTSPGTTRWDHCRPAHPADRNAVRTRSSGSADQDLGSDREGLGNSYFPRPSPCRR